MTLKEMAEKLNGKTYEYCLYKMHNTLAEEARNNGIVICTGASDDLIEFDGAIYDEGGCFDGGDVYFDKDSIAQNGEELPNKITVIWCGMVDGENAGPESDFKTEEGDLIVWCYKTDIPHETFMIFDDGEPYCRGIVFSMEAEYNRGLNEAWEVARKLAVSSREGGLDSEIIYDIFDGLSYYGVLKDVSASEAVAKIKEYEQQKQDPEIKVGDEVYSEMNDLRFIVTRIITSKHMDITVKRYEGICTDGACYDNLPEDIVKTGRTFPQISEVLEKMRGDKE